MVDSAFDPNSLLTMQITGANDTKLIPVPVGTYNAIVKDVKFRKGQFSKGERQGEVFVALDLIWSIDDQAVKEATKMDSPSVKQGFIIDMNPQGGIDMGPAKNVGLGKLREALGLNSPTAPFSFDMLKGRLAKVTVAHRLDDNPNSSTRGETFADVKAVAALV